MNLPLGCKRNFGSRYGIRQRIAAVLVIAVALLTNLGWTPEARSKENAQRIGILAADLTLNSEYAKQWWEPFRSTLADKGFIEGKNVSFELRKPSGDAPDFTEAANELVRLKVDVIWAISAPAVRAAYAATRTVPIVALDFTTDPVSQGYIENYARPGGNLTGVFLDAPNSPESGLNC
jgi:ABC-type uncharacterized transport system substrate-binding protein